MKHVKILGLAAVAAMALTAFLGASPASATVLCKTTVPSGCATGGWDYPAGTKLVISADGSLTHRNTAGSLQNECTESLTEAKTENTGSSTETVKSTVAEVSTWGHCLEEPTTTLEKGTLEIHYIPDNPNTTGHEMGTITASGWKFTTKIFGIPCTFTTGNNDDLGEITDVSETGNGTATVDIRGLWMGSGWLCPSSAFLEGHWWIIGPRPLYVSTN